MRGEIMMDYHDFLKQKEFNKVSVGFAPTDLNPNLWLHQPAIVDWACRRGRAAIFADTGLGKTLMQLAWADQVSQKTGKPVLLLAPLAVGRQTQAEAVKFGIESATQYVERPDLSVQIQITNYEKLDHFNPDDYAGIVLDESSILKGQTGAYRKMLTDFASNIEYRLSCTATPSPNDFMELGTQAEFLGIMSQVEMLSMFFTHDGSETQKWRLKGWGASKFWDWLATWAVVISSPADLGFDGSSYELPPLIIEEVILQSKNKDGLFADVAQGLGAARLAKKSSVSDRVAACAEWVNSLDEPCLVWAETNEEADKLTAAINGAVQVAGRDKDDHKVNAALWFVDDDSVIAVNGKLRKVGKCLGNQNTQQTEKQNTTQTQKKSKKGSGSQKEMMAENICESTDLKIEKSGIERKSSKMKSTEEGGRSTQTTGGTGMKLKEKSKSTSNQTQESGKTKDSSSTESQSMSSTICSKNKMENVQYADTTTCQIQHSSHSLTTATKQEKLEDCYAQNAISESEVLMTTTKESLELQSTSKRVLVSKSSIFGFGLNFQNACKMAFVGPTYSFEQFYQAVRRQWRFGQTKPVEVRVFMTEEETGIHSAMMQKMENDKLMRREMIKVMSDAMKKEITGASSEKADYVPTRKAEMPCFI